MILSYSVLLNKYIKESGQSLTVISQQLQHKGISVDRSYLSKLKTGAKPPASQELSKAIAEVTGGDPEALVFAGYFEKAPEELKSTITELNNEVYDTLDYIMTYATPSQMLELLVKIKRENIENLYVQGILNNLESLYDDESYDVEFDLSILSVYAKETFNLRDNLKMLVTVKLFNEHMRLSSSENQYPAHIDDSSNEHSVPRVTTNFASFVNKKEILSDDEAEFLQDCLIAYRKQQEKLKKKT
jgi:hypothetical protein